MVLEDELSSLNRDLSIFPTRAFEFKNAGTVVIEQVGGSSNSVLGITLSLFSALELTLT